MTNIILGAYPIKEGDLQTISHNLETSFNFFTCLSRKLESCTGFKEMWLDLEMYHVLTLPSPTNPVHDEKRADCFELAESSFLR